MYTLYYIENDKSLTMVRKDLSLANRTEIAALLGAWLAKGKRWRIVINETTKTIGETFATGDMGCEGDIIDKYQLIKTLARNRAKMLFKMQKEARNKAVS